MSPSNICLLSIILILTLTQIFGISNSQEFCNQNDKKVLLSIKNKLGNPRSLSSWDSNPDCVYWNEIRCNEKGRVTSLDINGAHDIYGPIPPYLDNLPFLTDLSLRDIPNLIGPVPSYLSKLTRLNTLAITGTKLTGPIPSFLGTFINLIQLDLSSNKFTGPVPNSFGRLKKLSYLDLSSNRLTGPVPIVLSQLTELTYLTLASNKLSGPIPEHLSQLKKANTINLDSNSLSGPIPSYLGHMPSLTSLALSYNQLTGPIPKSWGQNSLASINLAHNKLIGDASFLFDKANNSNTIDIQINNNFLKFDFSNEDLSRTLYGFNVSHNMIYGSLPKRFGELKVDFVDVSYNQLCGPIPNGRRFKRVNAAIFSHNKCLCGGPLPACK